MFRIAQIIVKKIKTKVESNENFAREYIKGPLAEGNANIKKTAGCLYMIRISAKEEAERKHFKRGLEKVLLTYGCCRLKNSFSVQRD
ncbi:MAG: hypothetical protein QMD14_04380 [Candidatus Aenigmarchaeota archaeon]|nr:hypothetical protein [Candidatus Aenigmarchaeota archaeon]